MKVLTPIENIVWLTKIKIKLAQGVPQDVPQEGIDDRIISLIRENKNITTEEIASILNVSSKTIKRHIEKMPNVKYVGSGYSGHWEIKDDLD